MIKQKIIVSWPGEGEPDEIFVVDFKNREELDKFKAILDAGEDGGFILNGQSYQDIYDYLSVNGRSKVVSKMDMGIQLGMGNIHGWW